MQGLREARARSARAAAAAALAARRGASAAAARGSSNGNGGNSSRPQQAGVEGERRVPDVAAEGRLRRVRVLKKKKERVLFFFSFFWFFAVFLTCPLLFSFHLRSPSLPFPPYLRDPKNKSTLVICRKIKE